MKAVLFANYWSMLHQVEWCLMCNYLAVVVILLFAGQEIISDADNKITDTVGNDLKNSGRFRLVEVGEEQIDGANFEAWRVRKVEAVVTGQIKSIGSEQYSIIVKLF